MFMRAITVPPPATNIFLNATFSKLGKNVLKPRIFTLLFVLLPCFLKAQYAVVGNTEECMNNISVYSVSGTPLPATYTWNVSGGYIVSTDTGTVSIGWSAVGSGAPGSDVA